MQLLRKTDIDRAKWDALVEKTATATIYDQSIFLDALAENWMLLVNENYTAGVAIPFTIRMGIKGIYTPNFIRELSFINFSQLSLKETEFAQNLLRKEFHFCNLNLAKNYFSESNKDLVYQVLKEEMKLNSQAKRSFKKFEKSSYKIEKSELSKVLSIVAGELTNKVESLRDVDMQRFENLLNKLSQEQLLVLAVTRENEFFGGQIFVRWKENLHYIKGGVRECAKNEGAMFAMMKQAIDFAKQEGLIVDFGGSNVAGVQRFNNSFGAEECLYETWVWDNSPFWFRFLKKIKNRSK